MSSNPVRIAIFASGSGNNANALINYFKNTPYIDVGMIATNKSKAGVLQVGEAHQLTTLVFRKSTLYQNPDEILKFLRENHIDFLVLAGFLLLMPATIVKAYPGKIVNIHPALLPSYGGKGMYGKTVHEAVKANRETLTGITVHYVNEAYDDGQIIEQVTCPVDPLKDSIDDIQQRVRQLELNHYPRIVHQVINSIFGLNAG
jgi:phosphoribosylglycinamide formyltransferase-1